MTTFKMFLSEGKQPAKLTWQTKDFHEFTAAVKSECSEYLKLNKATILKSDGLGGLWRGTSFGSEKASPLFSQVPRTDRRPMNLAVSFHNLANDYFKRKFNFKYRSSGVFCSQVFATAKQYGSPDFILPTNGYQLCSSKKVYDFYVLVTDPFDDSWGDINDLTHYVEDRVGKGGGATLEAEMKKLEQYFFKLKYNTQDVPDSGQFFEIMDYLKYFETKKLSQMNKSSEVMVKCDKYFGVSILRSSDKGINDLELIKKELYDL
jgi:hypothetical protein